MAWNNKSIPLVGGMDTSIGQGHHPPPLLSRLLNAKITSQGEITKRHAFRDISALIADQFTATRYLYDLDGNSAVAVPRSLITDASRRSGETADSMLMLTDQHLLKYITSVSGWVPRDVSYTSATEGTYLPTAVGCGVSDKKVLRSVSDQHGCQVATSTNYTVIAWIECEAGSAELDPRLFYSVYDNTSGDFIVDSVQAETTDVLYCHAVAVGANVGIVYVTGNNLKLINVSTPLAPVTYTLKTTAVSAAAGSGNPTPFYAAISKANTLMIAYRDTVANTTAFFSTWAGVVSATTSYGSATTETVCIERDSVNDLVVLAYCTGTGVNNITTKILDPSTLADLALDVQYTTSTNTRSAIRIVMGFNSKVMGVSASSAPDCWMAWELSNSGSQVNTVDFQSRFVATAVDGGTGIANFQCTLNTTIFKQGDCLYVGLGYAKKGTSGVSFQGGLYFVAIGWYNYQAGVTNKTLPLCLAGKYTPAAGNMENRRFDRRSPACRVTVRNASLATWRTGHRVRTKYIQSPGTTAQYFTRSVMLTLDFKVPVSYAHVDDFTYFANGSILKQHDGRGVTETGILLAPEVIASDGTVAGGGALSAGSYSWRFYYVSEIGGKRVRSYAVTVTKDGILANEQVSWVIPTLRFTQRTEGDVSIEVYRTAVNPTANSPFYRVTSVSPTAATGAGWFNNVFSAATVTIADGIADTALQLETDYLWAGEVGHVIPDIKYVVSANNRLMAASEYALHPSLLFSEKDAVEFSDELSQEFTDSGGPITGIAPLGNNIAVFKKNKTFVIGGDGPDNLGDGGYGQPYEVNHDVGASSMGAVCKTPLGIAFAGKNGLYLLGDSLQLDFIGKSVHRVIRSGNSSFTMKRVIFNSKENELHFFDGNNIFTYNTQFTAWSITPVPVSGSRDIAIYNDVLALALDGVLDGGTVCVQSATSWEDSVNQNGVITAVSFLHRIETDYINIAGEDAASWSRAKSVKTAGVQRNETYAVDTVYEVSEAYDNETAYEGVTGGTFTTPRTYTNTIAATKNFRFEHYFSKQKCSQIKIRIDNNDIGPGAALTHIVLRVKESENSAKNSPRETT